MALRTIRIQGDPVLTKKCREITEITPKIRELAEDMLDTMVLIFLMYKSAYVSN